MKSLNAEEKEIAFKVLDRVLESLKDEEKQWRECEKRHSDKGNYSASNVARSTSSGIGFSISTVEVYKKLVDELGVV